MPTGGAAYTAVTLDDVGRLPTGQLVSVDGWIGNFGFAETFLMFRDQAVAPPYVVVRAHGGALQGDPPAAAASSGPDRPPPTAAARHASLDRCRDACPVRVQGEVGPPAAEGEAPTLIAHDIRVGG
ncbi:MAG: hypothetical protein ACK4QW_00415 [Alphaproteobacteria bacterium]